MRLRPPPGQKKTRPSMPRLTKTSRAKRSTAMKRKKRQRSGFQQLRRILRYQILTSLGSPGVPQRPRETQGHGAKALAHWPPPEYPSACRLSSVGRSCADRQRACRRAQEERISVKRPKRSSARGLPFLLSSFLDILMMICFGPDSNAFWDAQAVKHMKRLTTSTRTFGRSRLPNSYPTSTQHSRQPSDPAVQLLHCLAVLALRSHGLGYLDVSLNMRETQKNHVLSTPAEGVQARAAHTCRHNRCIPRACLQDSPKNTVTWPHLCLWNTPVMKSTYSRLGNHLTSASSSSFPTCRKTASPTYPAWYVASKASWDSSLSPSARRKRCRATSRAAGPTKGLKKAGDGNSRGDSGDDRDVRSICNIITSICIYIYR